MPRRSTLFGLLISLMILSALLLSACAVNEDGIMVRATPGPTATVTVTATPTVLPLFEYYIVQRGDTLWKIAEQHGVDVEILAQVNEMDDPTALAVGQRILVSDFVSISGIYLPTPTPTPVPTSTPIPCLEGCRYRVPECEIKGIFARIDGIRLYLLPEDSYYNLREADVWFCKETDALQAGWAHWGELGVKP